MGTNYKYAKFGAKTIISESEQEKINSKIKTEKIKQISLKKSK